MTISNRKRFATVAAFAVLAAGAGSAAAVPTDGGDWDHGSSGGRVWSNFWHPSAWHGASVQGKTFVDSGCKAPDIWARAQAE